MLGSFVLVRRNIERNIFRLRMIWTHSMTRLSAAEVSERSGRKMLMRSLQVKSESASNIYILKHKSITKLVK